MTRVFLSDAIMDERMALRVMLQDLGLDVVGEAADWPNTLTQAPATHLEMLIVDWNLLPVDLGRQALDNLRLACPNAIVVVLISHLDARQQAALSSGADAFISKNESPERVAERLRNAAANIHII
jgi:DNA-binding NarL/FixJ family response regulator